MSLPIQLYLPETRFAVVSIPLAQYAQAVECLRELQDFVSLTRDKEEVTLILPESDWERIGAQFSDTQWVGQRRLIRFDAVLDFSVVGFIAEISRALAEADISILSVSTYKTDAVLVHESRFDDAIRAIKQALITLNFTHLAQH